MPKGKIEDMVREGAVEDVSMLTGIGDKYRKIDSAFVEDATVLNAASRGRRVRVRRRKTMPHSRHIIFNDPDQILAVFAPHLTLVLSVLLLVQLLLCAAAIFF